jgi:hypothetical protein
MATLMHRGFERAADRFGDRDAVRVGDERWSFRDHDGLANAFARHLGAHGVGSGDPRGGDDVEPRRGRRRGPRREQVRRCRRAAEPGVEGCRGRPRPRVGGPPRRRRRPDGRAAHRPAGRRRGHRPRRPVGRGGRPRPQPGPTRRGRRTRHRRHHPGLQVGAPRAPQGRGAHAPVDRPCHVGLVHRPRPRPRRPLPVATPPSHILGLLNLLAAAEAGATVRLHRRFELDEVLRRIATERMTLEMAVAPIALALARRRSVRLAPPRVAPRQRPRPAGRVDLGRLLGRAGGLAPGALRRRLLRPVVAHGTLAGGRRRRR